MRKLSPKILSYTLAGMVGAMSLFSLGTVVHGVGFDGQDTTFNPQVVGSTSMAEGRLITSITTGVNRILGMLALIALIILLWGGFQMITAAGDETKYKKGFKILEQAAIGLVFIGVSWLVVSLIFFLIKTFTA